MSAERELEARCWEAPVIADRYELLKYAVSQIVPVGTILEFGVAQGRSLRLLAEQAPLSTVYGFDSFKGLPEDWGRGENWHTPAGTYAGKPELTSFTPNVRLVTGLFEDTLPGWAETFAKASEEGQAITLVHIDCDLYSSTKTVLRRLKPHLRRGVVLVFDELMDFRSPPKYTKWPDHEFKALIESGLRVRPFARTPSEQVAVVLV